MKRKLLSFWHTPGAMRTRLELVISWLTARRPATGLTHHAISRGLAELLICFAKPAIDVAEFGMLISAYWLVYSCRSMCLFDYGNLGTRA